MLDIPTLITFNCAGAAFYQGLSVPYASPTIGNLFRDWRQFLRFAGNLEHYLSAEPRFGEPLLPRYGGTKNHNYPVMFLDDVEIHWIHEVGLKHPLHRLAVGKERTNWRDIVVSFSESNFGAPALSAADWQDFVFLWSAVPHRKVFLATGRYVGLPDGRTLKQWADRKHEDVCTAAAPCKPTCPGCGRAKFGGFREEALRVAGWLKMGDRFRKSIALTPSGRRDERFYTGSAIA